MGTRRWVWRIFVVYWEDRAIIKSRERVRGGYRRRARGACIPSLLWAADGLDSIASMAGARVGAHQRGRRRVGATEKWVTLMH